MLDQLCIDDFISNHSYGIKETMLRLLFTGKGDDSYFNRLKKAYYKGTLREYAKKDFFDTYMGCSCGNGAYEFRPKEAKFSNSRWGDWEYTLTVKEFVDIVEEMIEEGY